MSDGHTNTAISAGASSQKRPIGLENEKKRSLSSLSQYIKCLTFGIAWGHLRYISRPVY